MNLMDYFPGTPRGEQENVVNKIQKAFDSGKKFIICQAPTGSGKSHIGATACLATTDTPKSIKDALITPKSHFSIPYEEEMKYGGFILTTSKQLQDQYMGLFPDLKRLKGKNNYPCALDPLYHAGCAKCVYFRPQLDKCASSGDCEYINSYSEAMKSKFSVLNYNMYLSLPPSLKHRDTLICDEASELEDVLVGTYSFNVKYKYLDFLKVPYTTIKSDSAEDGFLWISELKGNVDSSIPSQKRLTASKGDKLKNKAIKLREMSEKLKDIHNCWHESEFIVEKLPDGVNISPLKVNKLSRMMFDKADNVILMSATIINPTKFAETLGIAKDDYIFIDVKSSFPPKRSPIYIAPAKYDMRYGAIDRELPKLAKAVAELCEHHGDENGIIHTHNFKITQAIKAEVGSDPRFLFRDKYSTNEDILREHFEIQEPTILVSPSLAFGTSLDNEHGRFQIITKMPYLPMSDKRIKTIAKGDFNWYEMKMWVSMIQMCGRCTRSDEDHSSTYIFDKSFIKAIERYGDRLPKWFTDRLV